MISIAFLIAALILFVIGTIPGTSTRINLVSAGLACLAVSLLLPRI